MINRYRKKGTPAWQRRLVLFVAFLFGATVLLFAAWTVMLLLQRP